MLSLALAALLTCAPVTPLAARPLVGLGLHGQEDDEQPVLTALEDCLEYLRKGGPESSRRRPDPDPVAEANIVLNEVVQLWNQHAWRREAIAKTVLDLIGTLTQRREQGLGNQLEKRLHERLIRMLGLRLDERTRRWITREVAPSQDAHPLERRIGACLVLGEDEQQSSILALFMCTRAKDRLLRKAATEGLVGRDVDVVHARLIDLLAEAEADGPEVPAAAIERHFREHALSPESSAHAAVLRYVRTRLASESWRRASRAISISRCLDSRVMIGPLIESLSIWITREAGELPSKRIQGELATELGRRTGRNLGLHPDRWRQFWRGVLTGDAELGGHVEGQVSFTQADFFGLRPMTDRVTFVLDRSGSMEEPFGLDRTGSQGRLPTRYREALAQMGKCLEGLGPRTKFNLVLFSDRAWEWRNRLQAAKPINLRSATQWALNNGPQGGTQLKLGVEQAYCIDRRGRLDLERLEADTIIVLCDGQTAEGKRWVRPLLERYNDEARVVFHAVQIGAGGDGTLEALCELTGGNYVRVGE